MPSKLETWLGLVQSAKAVLYDFDGVLVDSEKFYHKSYNKAFSGYGHKVLPKDYWKYWSGLGQNIKEESDRQGLGLTPEQIKHIYSLRMKYYSEFILSGKVPFIEDSYATIGLFRRAGHKVAIASGSYENDLKNMFKVHKRNPGIAIIGRKKGLKSKPRPDIFVYAAGYIHSEPLECLVIEDAMKGLVAAKAVGMACVIIRNKVNRTFDFPGADLVFNSYKEFHELTEKAFKVLKRK